MSITQRKHSCTHVLGRSQSGLTAFTACLDLGWGCHKRFPCHFLGLGWGLAGGSREPVTMTPPSFSLKKKNDAPVPSSACSTNCIGHQLSKTSTIC